MLGYWIDGVLEEGFLDIKVVEWLGLEMGMWKLGLVVEEDLEFEMVFVVVVGCF